MTTQLETDYLIIGAGAVGLAFADVLLTETDASILIVDKHHMPGGHWNDAYPFVTLHQPSAFYGVSSKELSQGRTAKVGLNKGLAELATGAEILSYFDDLMRDRFLPSGRVRYFPMCEFTGDGEFNSLISEARYSVKVNKRTVDATYFGTNVPSTHTPSFSIAEGLNFCPLNDLPKLTQAHDHYMIIGGGKTGIDAVIWLLQNGINPDKISWVMPRDAWLINRQNTQPGEAFFEYTIGSQAAQMEALAQADSIDDLFKRLEDSGVLLRLDPNITPKMFHGATISDLELSELRKVKNVIRMGHISEIGKTQITFTEGTISTPENALFIDCSACAVTERPQTLVFDNDLITIQTVRSFQPVFSAGFIAHIEATYTDQDKKNALCTVVPLPNHDTDWIRCTGGQMYNQFMWSQEPGLREWLVANRLDGFSAMMANVDKDDAAKMAIVGRIRANSMAAMDNVQRFVSQVHAQTTAKA